MTSFTSYSRAHWHHAYANAPVKFDPHRLKAVVDSAFPVSPADVEDVYVPLARLIRLRMRMAEAAAMRRADACEGATGAKRPFMIAVGGSVAVGKSVAALILANLLRAGSDEPDVRLVASDGFLLSRNQLIELGLMSRKGFPESYDAAGMTRFLQEVREGRPARAPSYSHETYDILPNAFQEVGRADILLIEGLNVIPFLGAPSYSQLQGESAPTFDMSIFIDADRSNIERWYVRRFIDTRRRNAQMTENHFHALAAADDLSLEVEARRLWREVNLPNLLANIEPIKGFADVIIRKSDDHSVDVVLKRWD